MGELGFGRSAASPSLTSPSLANEPATPSDDFDYFEDCDDLGCWNCNGNGFYASCFQEFACMYPDEGCDLCTRRCNVCNPRSAPREDGSQPPLTSDGETTLGEAKGEAEPNLPKPTKRKG